MTSKLILAIQRSSHPTPQTRRSDEVLRDTDLLASPSQDVSIRALNTRCAGASVPRHSCRDSNDPGSGIADQPVLKSCAAFSTLDERLYQAAGLSASDEEFFMLFKS